jgi:hypothetical protein
VKALSLTQPWAMLVVLINEFGQAEKQSDKERAFGDYSNGRIAIQLSGPQLNQQAISVTGALGLWTVPETIEQQVRLVINCYGRG